MFKKKSSLEAVLIVIGIHIPTNDELIPYKELKYTLVSKPESKEDVENAWLNGKKTIAKLYDGTTYSVDGTMVTQVYTVPVFTRDELNLWWKEPKSASQTILGYYKKGSL